jgi:hypothetical protein
MTHEIYNFKNRQAQIAQSEAHSTLGVATGTQAREIRHRNVPILSEKSNTGYAKKGERTRLPMATTNGVFGGPRSVQGAAYPHNYNAMRMKLHGISP